MTNNKIASDTLRQTQPGTYLFRVGFLVVAAILLLWLAGSFAMRLFFPPQWVLTVNEPVEKTSFTRQYHTEAQCHVVLARWQAEAARLKAEGKPADAPTAACHHL
ncbi:MAG: hypothetical protein ACXWLJ_12250 [Rhizomicrobium sp.]